MELKWIISLAVIVVVVAVGAFTVLERSWESENEQPAGGASTTSPPILTSTTTTMTTTTTILLTTTTSSATPTMTTTPTTTTTAPTTTTISTTTTTMTTTTSATTTMTTAPITTTTTPTVEVVISYVHYDATGNDWYNLNDEYVIINNDGSAQADMTAWILEDLVAHVYHFPSGFTLEAGSSVIVYTGSGINTQDHLYWGSGAPVWNNDHDTAYLYDENWNLIDFYSW